MPWNWGAKASHALEVGGNVGTTAEAKEVKSWPNYDAAYLAHRLGAKEPGIANMDRYDSRAIGLTGGANIAYLNKVTENYKEEAEQCLRSEFVDWLQGTHEDNKVPIVYQNNPGQMPRRALGSTVDGGAGVKHAGQQLDNWVPTWWNTINLHIYQEFGNSCVQTLLGQNLKSLT